MFNSKQLLFIDEYLKASDHINAYMVAFKVKDKQIARVAGLRLLKSPKIAFYVSGKEAERDKIINDVRRKDIEAKAITLLTDDEIEMQLCRIISEDFEYNELIGYKMVMNENGKEVPAPIRFKRRPTPMEIKSAADLLFKKRGSNAPYQMKVEGGLTIIPALSPAEIKALNDAIESKY